MNKKLIKTIASVTCGLGIASSIPFMTTSCGSSKPVDNFIPDGELTNECFKRGEKKDGSQAKDIVDFSSSGKQKLLSLKDQGYNAIKISTFGDTDCNFAMYSSAWIGLDYIKTIEFSSEIIKCNLFTAFDYQEIFPKSIEKIIIDADTFTFGVDGIDNIPREDKTFNSSTYINTIQFTNITDADKINFFNITSLKNLGKYIPDSACKIIFRKDVSQPTKEEIYNKMVSSGLDSNKWKYHN